MHNVSLSLTTAAVYQYGGAAATGSYVLIWEADVADADYADAVRYALALAEARFDCETNGSETWMVEPTSETGRLTWWIDKVAATLTLASVAVPASLT